MSTRAVPIRPTLLHRISKWEMRIGLGPTILLALIAGIIILALLADVLAPYSPTDIKLVKRLLPPLSAGYLLGTDALGRDILSRLIHGSRVSVSVVAVSIILGGGVGTILGIISAYYGKSVDAFIMRLSDVMLGFPLMIFAILFAAVFGPSFGNVVIVLALGMWAKFARIARAETLSLKEKDFVAAARVAGVPTVHIMLRHIAPHLLSSLLILVSLQAAWAVIVEAGLSFFGVGVPPPAPSWGGMITDGREFVTNAWWIPFFPGLAIVILVLSLNLLGDWLRDHLDPRLRQAG